MGRGRVGGGRVGGGRVNPHDSVFLFLAGHRGGLRGKRRHIFCRLFSSTILGQTRISDIKSKLFITTKCSRRRRRRRMKDGLREESYNYALSLPTTREGKLELRRLYKYCTHQIKRMMPKNEITFTAYSQIITEKERFYPFIRSFC